MANNRTELVKLRLREEEKAEWEALAEQMKVSLSDLIRVAVLRLMDQVVDGEVKPEESTRPRPVLTGTYTRVAHHPRCNCPLCGGAGGKKK